MIDKLMKYNKKAQKHLNAAKDIELFLEKDLSIHTNFRIALLASADLHRKTARMFMKKCVKLSKDEPVRKTA